MTYPSGSEILLLSFIIFWIWSLVDVLKSQFNNNGKIIWFLIVFFGSILGSLIYLIFGRSRRIKSDEKKQPSSQKTKNIFIGILAVAVIIGAYFIYADITHPSDAVVKNIASQMISRPEEKIEVVSSYKSNGGIMMVLKIGQAICEMPMVKSDSDGWIGHGINCQGNLHDTSDEAPSAILPPEPSMPTEEAFTPVDSQ